MSFSRCVTGLLKGVALLAGQSGEAVGRTVAPPLPLAGERRHDRARLDVTVHPIALALLAATLAGAASAEIHACDFATPCAVENGSYLVRPPAGWDGRSALPVVVFFHGWQQSAGIVMQDETMARVLSDLGVMLVAPDGAGRSWSHPGSPSRDRDEFAFIRAVLDDVVQRFPVDRARLWASGFSQGGSMAWYAACYLGDRFAAFVTIAGDFWEPAPTVCPSGPASILHIHGENDQTVPMAGRAIGDRYRQSDLRSGWALWRRTDRCAEAPDRTETIADLTCTTWTGGRCESGRELMLCLHPGGHDFKAEWLGAGYGWVDGLARRSGPEASPSGAL